MKPWALVLLLAGMSQLSCSTVPSPDPETADPETADPGPAHSTALLSLLWLQRSAEYAAIAKQTYQMAQWQLRDRVADRSSGKPAAVVLDIDETVLLNTQFAAWLLLRGKSFNIPDWTSWCRQEAATAVPGAVEFITYLRSQGIALVYVSNRSRDVAGATENNLRKLGLWPEARGGSPAVAVYYREDEARLGGSVRTTAKTRRMADVASRYRILQVLGDNLADFSGGGMLSEEERMALVDVGAGRWGRQWFLLPNPVYGTWLDSLMGYRSLEPEQKYVRELDLLRVMQ